MLSTTIKAVFVLFNVILLVSARSETTRLKVVNLVDVDIINTDVGHIASYDWYGGSRPDQNFQGKKIKSGDSDQERDEVNYYASNCPVQIDFIMSDGTHDTLRWNQKYAINKASLGLVQGYRTGSHLVEFTRIDGNTLCITFSKKAKEE